MQKYGNTVLSAPTSSGFNMVAWIMPFAVFAAASALTVWLVRLWKSRPVAQPVAQSQPEKRATRRTAQEGAPGDRILIYSFVASVIAAQETPFILFGCALFAAALFVYVFYQPGEVEIGEAKTRYGYLQERKDATYENLRDLNFEYKAGKLSEAGLRHTARFAGR